MQIRQVNTAGERGRRSQEAKIKRRGETEIPLKAKNKGVSSTLQMRFAEQFRYASER